MATPTTNSAEPSNRREPGARRPRALPATYEAAVAALARRPHARAELERKLVRKGHERGEVEVALDRAAELGYLDDAAYARSLVGRRSAARGTAAIGAELRAKGLSRPEIEAALAALDPEAEHAAALRLAERLVKPGGGREEVERAAAKLVRRGFSSEVAWRCARAAASGPAESETT